MNAARPTPFANLLRAAILGTQHAGPDVECGDAEADAFLAAREGEPAERTLLRAAALFAVVERTALPPVSAEGTEAGPVVDRVPRCSPLAADDLRAILAGDRGEALTEWLFLANAAGRRAPDELLPALLNRGAQSTNLRSAIHPVLDARGWWLAAQHPRWRYAIASDDDARTFDEADTIAARASALTRLRATDPASALARLEASWATEQPDDRAPLLAALEVGLSRADEPFLERARDDKRKPVRTIAASLLLSLPESAATTRAIAMAAPLVRVEPRRLLAPRKLVLELPAACTPEMIRDGFEPKSPRPDAGDRAWWLQQLLASVPPAFWRASLGITTGDLLELARESEFRDAATIGFVAAIKRFRDTQGLADLLDLASHEPAFVSYYRSANHPGLSDEFRERPILEALKHRREGADFLLGALRGPWSREISKAALVYARGLAETAGDTAALLRRREIFRTIGVSADPRIANIGHGWPERYSSERVREYVEAMLAELAFRGGLYEHFEESSES